MPVRHLTSVDGDLVCDLDPSLHEVSGGPVLLAEDLTADGTAVVARSATYRAALFEQRVAGAAVGIRPRLVDTEAETRRRALDELAELPEGHGFAPDPVDGLAAPALAHGIVAALEGAIGGLSARTVAVEDLGPLGIDVARRVVERGGLVVGASTHHGAVATATGLDVDELAALHAEHGDLCVAHVEGLELHRADELLGLAVDAIVLHRPVGSLGVELADRIGAEVVVPSTPVPWTEAGLDALHRRRIVAVPDFAATAGPALLASAPGGLRDDERLRRVVRLIGERLDAARLARMDPIRYCASLADTFLTTWVDAEHRPDGPPVFRPAQIP